MFLWANGAGSAVDGTPRPATVEASGSRFTGPENGTALERGDVGVTARRAGGGRTRMRIGFAGNLSRIFDEGSRAEHGGGGWVDSPPATVEALGFGLRAGGR